MKKNDLLPPDEIKMPEPKPDSETSDSKDPSVGKPDNIESDKKDPDLENPNKEDFDNEKNSFENTGDKETDGNNPMHVFAPGFLFLILIFVSYFINYI